MHYKGKIVSGLVKSLEQCKKLIAKLCSVIIYMLPMSCIMLLYIVINVQCDIHFWITLSYIYSMN